MKFALIAVVITATQGEVRTDDYHLDTLTSYSACVASADEKRMNVVNLDTDLARTATTFICVGE